jgi:hypothetical protein
MKMKTRSLNSRKMRNSLRLFSALAALALLAMAVFGAGVTAQAAGPQPTPPVKGGIVPGGAAQQTDQSAVQAPVALAPAALVDSGACSVTAGVENCSLYAKTGTLTLPDNTTAPIWGYSATSGGAAGLPGPTLVITGGMAVNITLYNVNLPSATSLSISQQAIMPDTTGAAPNSNKTYSFAATDLQPGTYLYEAGLTADGPRQAAMGLFGALVVRPATCAACAYDANSAFNDEALLVLSEVDPAFNAAPLTFQMSGFSPKYWLINGKGYPNTDPIGTGAGRKVLLRYVNAGLVHHSMSLLGLHQTIIAIDGKTETNPSRVVAQTIPAGSNLDTITTIPASALPGAQYALFDAAMRMDNNGTLGAPATNPAYTPIAFGGMLTFLSVAGGGFVNPGPTTSNAAALPSPTNGSVAVQLTASTQAMTGTVSAAEYLIDATSGSGTAMSGAFGAAAVNVSATISVAQLAALSSGTHTFYIHAQDSTGMWGPFASAVLNLDKAGPAVTNQKLTPGRTNGTVAVNLQATASDVASGNANVTAAEYFIDPAGTPAPGSGTAIPVATPAAVVSLNATIAAATVNGLADGNHTVAVRAQDALGNWGAFGTVPLVVDKTAPTISSSSTTPNPTNGTFGVQGGTGGGFYQRIDAAVSDPTAGGINSNIVAAEYSIDTPGTPGAGQAMLATDGVYNGTTESVYQLLDLPGIIALTQGQHTIYVRGKDAAGNWGANGTILLNIDKTAPAITALGISPNPNNGANTVTLSFTATDPANNGTPANAPASNIVAAEWFMGTDPGVGLATPIAIATPAASVNVNLPINTTSFLLGSYTFGVRAQDAAHNWSATQTVTLTINQRANAIFADGFDAGNFNAWSATGGTAGRIAVSAAAAQAGGFGMAATISGGTSGFVQDNSPLVETSYHARFYFNPNSFGATTAAARTIFTGLNAAGNTIFSVSTRRQANGTYQVIATVSRSGGASSTQWVTIPGNAFTAIEISWQSAGAANFSMYVGGTQYAVAGTVNTSAFILDTVRLGPQGTMTGVTGTMRFDSFVSTRNTVVGP